MKSNLVIKEKKLPKNEEIAQKERENSPEYKARMAEGEKMQANVQGSLSDLARKHNVAGGGAIPEDELHSWNDNTVPEFAGKPAQSRRNRGGWRNYVAVGNKWVPTFDEDEDKK